MVLMLALLFSAHKPTIASLSPSYNPLLPLLPSPILPPLLPLPLKVFVFSPLLMTFFVVLEPMPLPLPPPLLLLSLLNVLLLFLFLFQLPLVPRLLFLLGLLLLLVLLPLLVLLCCWLISEEVRTLLQWSER